MLHAACMCTQYLGKFDFGTRRVEPGTIDCQRRFARNVTTALPKLTTLHIY